ncbi:hypothetical protein ACC691_41355, partial [Rhizobium johnstonii]|uniref:hypothetical protein n=1 Tax=Rhizobium johnstonii TaxID=3019933 RepID=UPI003F95FDE0
DPVPDWVTSAASLEELGAVFGISVDALRETVDRFNLHARAGIDPDYTRGERQSKCDRAHGDIDAQDEGVREREVEHA